MLASVMIPLFARFRSPDAMVANQKIYSPSVASSVVIVVCTCVVNVVVRERHGKVSELFQSLRICRRRVVR